MHNKLALANWDVNREITAEEVPENIKRLLVADEEIVAAYEHIYVKAVFTDRRIIVKVGEGLTGRRVETFSVPYYAVLMWSIEEAGMMDKETEINLWTEAGNIQISVDKSVDLEKIEVLLANATL